MLDVKELKCIKVVAPGICFMVVRIFIIINESFLVHQINHENTS